MAHTVFHTCSLCEATCGLKFEVEDNQILSVRPDEDDVFSQGYVCPKGIAIAGIHHDPDRLRRPVRRNRRVRDAAVPIPDRATFRSNCRIRTSMCRRRPITAPWRT